jgi:nucleoside-diphosphate kinase
MNTNQEVILSFIATWFDPHSEIMKRFLLKFFPESNEIEMKDATTGRKFLKRTKAEISKGALRSDDFRIGNTVNIFSRDLKLVEYGDSSTRTLLEKSMEKSIVLLTFHSIEEIGQLIHHIERSGLILDSMRSFHMSKRMLQETLELLDVSTSLYHRNEDFEALVAVAFRGSNAVERLSHEIMVLDQNILPKPCLYPKSHESATHFYDMFLGIRHVTSARMEGSSTCCIIKPHAVKARATGSILHEIIAAGFVVTSLGVYRMERSAAAEFLNVYHGVMDEFNQLVEEMSSGPLVAIEVEADAEEFRKFIGPWDMEMAKTLFPESLRAKFGNSRVENALHCTDLPQHADFELRYFFELLDSLGEEEIISM